MPSKGEKNKHEELKINTLSHKLSSRMDLSETSSLLQLASGFVETKVNKPKTVKLYYGTKKIKLLSGKCYLHTKPYYCNPELYKRREEIYKINREMLQQNIEYEVIFLTDNIQYPYEELDEKESITVKEEKLLIKKYASALNDDDAREALRDMWKLQSFCDLVIESDKEKAYIVHQIIFCYYSRLLR
jgi:hypothetical protein